MSLTKLLGIVLLAAGAFLVAGLVIAFFVLWFPIQWLVEPSRNLSQEEELRSASIALEPVMNMHRWSATTGLATSGKWSDLPGPTPYARERPLRRRRGAAASARGSRRWAGGASRPAARRSPSWPWP